MEKGGKMAKNDRMWNRDIYYPSEGRAEWLCSDQQGPYSLESKMDLSQEEQIVLRRKHMSERD